MAEVLRVARGRWTKGQTGNPGGNPSRAAWWRARCRRGADVLMLELERRIRENHMRDWELDELLAAMTALADRGGLLTGDKLAAAEAVRARTLLEVVAAQGIPDPIKARLISGARDHEASALGEDEDAPEGAELLDVVAIREGEP